MTAPHIVDPAHVLGNLLTDASPDMMRHLLQTMINQLLSADADAVCGAEWGQPSPERVAQRNGYRHRPLDTRVGTIDVAVPKLRSGSYFPEWLLERRKRAETALITVIADCYLAGVSTRRMDKLVPRPSTFALLADTPGRVRCWVAGTRDRVGVSSCSSPQECPRWPNVFGSGKLGCDTSRGQSLPGRNDETRCHRNAGSSPRSSRLTRFSSWWSRSGRSRRSRGSSRSTRARSGIG